MKQDYELDVDERFAFFKNLVAPSGGFVVLDTGVIGGFDFSALLKSGELHGQELKKTLSAECALLERLHNLFKEKCFVFPQEVRGEYKLLTNRLEDQGRYHGENGWYIPLIRARRQLFNDSPQFHEILHSSILPHVSIIEKAVIDISREVYNSNISLKQAREFKRGLPKHITDDEMILAKSFAMSYASPTRVVSGDGDFVEIYRGIALNADMFMQRGVPSLPDNPFELVFVGKTGNTELFDFSRARRRRTYRDN